jgi:RsiW-degrading membrane proteinase PrsW (M82 family)
MKNILLVTTCVMSIFVLLKFIEYRVTKDTRPFKTVIKESMIVGASVFIAYNIFEQITPMFNLDNTYIPPAVFTEDPEF